MTKRNVPDPKEYLATKKWHELSGSFSNYVRLMQAQASSDNAPLDALFKRDDKWVCVSDLKPDHPFRLEWEKENPK